MFKLDELGMRLARLQDDEGEFLSLEALGQLEKLSRAAGNLWSGATKLESQQDNPEYLRGQVELICDAVPGLTTEYDHRNIVEDLIFHFSVFENR